MPAEDFHWVCVETCLCVRFETLRCVSLRPPCWHSPGNLGKSHLMRRDLGKARCAGENTAAFVLRDSAFSALFLPFVAARLSHCHRFKELARCCQIVPDFCRVTPIQRWFPVKSDTRWKCRGAAGLPPKSVKMGSNSRRQINTAAVFQKEALEPLRSRRYFRHCSAHARIAKKT